MGRSARRSSIAAALLAAATLVAPLSQATAAEPRGLFGRIGRIFRPAPRPSPSRPPAPDRGGDKEEIVRSIPAGRVVDRPPPLNGPAAVETPSLSSTGPGVRLTPQPRVTRPITEADPILTRISLARSDNGGRFGMFLQVFADGTVLDGEGAHQVGSDVIKAIQKAIEEGEMLRRRGHCGGPSTDFVEQYHLTLYDRSGKALRAGAFTYTGNPSQGCDPSVQKLHEAIDALLIKISRPASDGPIIAAPAPTAASAPPPPVVVPPAASPTPAPAPVVSPPTADPAPADIPIPALPTTLPPLEPPDGVTGPSIPLSSIDGPA